MLAYKAPETIEQSITVGKIIYAVKPPYDKHQRDRLKAVHYGKCSFYRGFPLNKH